MRNYGLKLKISGLLFVTFCSLFFVFNLSGAHASRIDKLKSKINEHNRQIEQIQKEISEYQKQIDKSMGEAASLKNKIRRLEYTRKKLNSGIYLTQNQIGAAGLNIERLSLEISLKEKEIKGSRISMAETIRNINETESQSIIEITLAHNKFSEFFNDLERMESFQKEISVNLNQLKKLKQILQKESDEKKEEKNNLENLKSRLVDQRIIVDANKTRKSQLFRETKNREKNYRKLLADRLTKQKALQKEINEFEAQLQIEINPKSLPPAGSGVLKWPLDKIKITQYFGNTRFATKNPQIYNGGGHNGVDFRASMGTPVKSAKEGKIVGVGNTDRACKGVSYGKWVLIQHSNNLTTLYAHLSLIKVSKGQTVKTGQIIGYSGDTGYTTGPHLHFSVFASAGVKVRQIRSRVCGTMMTLPAAPHNSYLNPLSYL